MTEVILVVTMALVTFIPRYLPFVLAERLRFPKVIEEALQYVPVAVLTVIVIQSVAFRNGSLQLTNENPYLWAMVAAFLVALVQKNMLITIVSGMAVFSFVKWWLL